MSLAHILLTRFNLPSSGAESLVRAREGWLRERQGLFERYCLPSVLAQSEQDFQWIIYFDTHSPRWLQRRAAELSRGGVFTAKYRESVSTRELVSDVRDVIHGEPDRLVTTNLDNDDALASDFVERIRRRAPASGRVALYVPWGLIRFRDHVYLRRDASNAFCSVAEGWEEPMTCWADWHNALGEHMPVSLAPGPPGWLQVVHHGNVSNRVRGRLVSPRPYENAFGDLLADAHSPRNSEFVTERLWHVPRRAAREMARQAVKRGVLAVAGREGLDKAKQLGVLGRRASVPAEHKEEPDKRVTEAME